MTLGHLDKLSPTRSEGRRLRFNADAVVDRSANTLFAAEITFGGLDRDMAKQELDLLQFSSGRMAQFRARAPEIMRRDAPEAEFGGVLLYDVPNQAFGHAVTPALSGTANAAE